MSDVNGETLMSAKCGSGAETLKVCILASCPSLAFSCMYVCIFGLKGASTSKAGVFNLLSSRANLHLSL